jgi:hypothetical protein
VYPQDRQQNARILNTFTASPPLSAQRQQGQHAASAALSVVPACMHACTSISVCTSPLYMQSFLPTHLKKATPVPAYECSVLQCTQALLCNLQTCSAMSTQGSCCLLACLYHSNLNIFSCRRLNMQPALFCHPQPPPTHTSTHPLNHMHLVTSMPVSTHTVHLQVQEAEDAAGSDAMMQCYVNSRQLLPTHPRASLTQT